MTGVAVAAGNPGVGAVAAERPCDLRVAVGKYLVRTEGGVAGADEFGKSSRTEAEPLPVVELAVRGTGR